MTISAIFDSYWYWFSACLLLLLLEILIPGAFLMWIGFGAAGVGFFLWLFPQADMVWQLFALAISVVGAVLIGLHWQKQSKKHPIAGLNQGLEMYIGRAVLVSEDFNSGVGRIRVDDSFFTANSTDLLVQGQRAVVTEVRDTILIVKAEQNSQCEHRQNGDLKG